MGKIREDFNNYMNASNQLEQELMMRRMMYDMGIMCTFILVNFILGPWLWNNVLVRLMPMVKPAEWYDTVLLSVLFGLIFNN